MRHQGGQQDGGDGGGADVGLHSQPFQGGAGGGRGEGCKSRKRRMEHLARAGNLTGVARVREPLLPNKKGT